MTPNPNEMLKIRLIERRGTVEYSYRTKEFITRDEHWIVNGKRFDHAPTGREVEDAYAEKRSDLAPTSQWRSMESAPKDGTTVMLWCEYDDEPQVAKFRKNKWEVRANGQHAVSYMSDFGTDYHYADNPTHWQPITPPTKDLADAGKENI